VREFALHALLPASGGQADPQAGEHASFHGETE